jgi:hypothetical protein
MLLRSVKLSRNLLRNLRSTVKLSKLEKPPGKPLRPVKLPKKPLKSVELVRLGKLPRSMILPRPMVLPDLPHLLRPTGKRFLILLYRLKEWRRFDFYGSRVSGTIASGY